MFFWAKWESNPGLLDRSNGHADTTLPLRLKAIRWRDGVRGSFFPFLHRDLNPECQDDSLVQWPLLHCSDGSRLKFFDPGRVRHLWFGLEFGKFPLNMSNFSIFFPLGQKNCFGSGRKVPGSKPGRLLIYCGSKVSSGRVRAHLYTIVTTFTWERKKASNGF